MGDREPPIRAWSVARLEREGGRLWAGAIPGKAELVRQWPLSFLPLLFILIGCFQVRKSASAMLSSVFFSTLQFGMCRSQVR